MTVKDILNELAGAPNHRKAGAVIDALALLQTELDKCLPEKEEEEPPTSTLEGSPIEVAYRNYTWGYNKAIDDCRHRLREFIGTDKEKP